MTSKGEKIMSSMRKQYPGRAKEVFYRSANKGTIRGVHKGKRKKNAYSSLHGK